MKKTILLIMVAMIAMSVPAMAAKVQNVPIPHDCFLVYQAYCGLTCCDENGDDDSQTICPDNHFFKGYDGFGFDVITAVPGVLAIKPGVDVNGVIDWSNYVSAAQAGIGSPASPIAYTITNVSMRKTVPSYVCTVAIGGAAVLQQGTANIRLWWPLMYELPGTKWTLTITYKTAINWNDGVPGNLPGTTHQDVWCWEVDATLESMGNLIDLFHELPAGSCQVPLIYGEDLYESLKAILATLEGMDPADPEMAEVFASFILLLEDNCLTVDCGSCSSDLGIRNTTENPACCKLLADADFIAAKLGVFIPSK